MEEEPLGCRCALGETRVTLGAMIGAEMVGAIAIIVFSCLDLLYYADNGEPELGPYRVLLDLTESHLVVASMMILLGLTGLYAIWRKTFYSTYVHYVIRIFFIFLNIGLGLASSVTYSRKCRFSRVNPVNPSRYSPTLPPHTIKECAYFEHLISNGVILVIYGVLYMFISICANNLHYWSAASRRAPPRSEAQSVTFSASTEQREANGEGLRFLNATRHGLPAKGVRLPVIRKQLPTENLVATLETIREISSNHERSLESSTTRSRSRNDSETEPDEKTPLLP